MQRSVNPLLLVIATTVMAVNHTGNQVKLLDGNQVVFTVLGETTRESGYAHLVIPIPLPNLTSTLEVLVDLVEARTSAALAENNLYKRSEQYGLNMIQQKIELILSLARKEGFVSSVLHHNDINLIQTELNRLSDLREK